MNDASLRDNSWTDEAIEKGEQDALGRLPYARRAADLIEEKHTMDSSTVFGLSGPWGSGKTSLVNMIVEALQDSHPNWSIARFTPWATSDLSGLLGDFYSSLSDALPSKRSKEIRKSLAVTAAVAAPAATLIPMAGGAASKAVQMAGEALAKQPSWQAAFDKASARIRELGKPILVVVDDIDRLQVEELMALLKVVRLLGRFDGVQYLLAYDDETLYRSMSSVNGATLNDGTAERFMEKIVQYPLFVPPLLRHQQVTRLNAGLMRVARERSDDDGASRQRISGLLDCFLDLLQTPRAIDRYIAQLEHHVPLLPPDEIDDEDLALLTLIRVSFPMLFNAIPRYRQQLLSGSLGEMDFDSRPLRRKPFELDVLLDLVPADRKRAAREVLVALFPKIRAQNQMSVHGSRRRQSVQHDNYFDRYFAMGILDHDVSDETVARAVRAAVEGEGQDLMALLLAGSDDLRRLVLSKAAVDSLQPDLDSGRLKLAESLVRVCNELPRDDSGPFSDLDLAFAWVGELLGGLAQDTPTETVREVIWELEKSVLRIRAWRRVENSIQKLDGDAVPPWFEAVSSEIADDAISEFVEHLEQGDDAPEGFGVGYQVHFALRVKGDRLRERVREMISSGAVPISVLASRLTGARTVTGTTPDWQLSPDFDQETFDQLAPALDDPWFDEPQQQADVRDLSWANRRRFATGRVSRPPQTPS